MRKVKSQKVKGKSTGRKSKLLKFAQLPEVIVSLRGATATKQSLRLLRSLWSLAMTPRRILSRAELLLKFLLLNFGFAFCLFTFALNCYASSDDESFSLGAGLYKKKEYQKAIEAFTRALVSNDRQVEADASYNLGNCKYKLGKINEKADLSTAVGSMQEALDYYKRAIDLDKKNNDARFNYEFVDKEVKVLLEKLKQQESKSDKQKGEQGQNKDKQDKKDKDSSGQEQSQQQKQDGDNKDKKGQKESQQEKDKKEEGKEAKQGAQEEDENKELSEDGAKALLERYGREDLKPDSLDKREFKGYDREVTKDW